MEPLVQVTSTKDNYLIVNVFALTCLFRQIKFNWTHKIRIMGLKYVEQHFTKGSWIIILPKQIAQNNKFITKKSRYLWFTMDILPIIPYIFRWTNSGNYTWNIYENITLEQMWQDFPLFLKFKKKLQLA